MKFNLYVSLTWPLTFVCSLNVARTVIEWVNKYNDNLY